MQGKSVKRSGRHKWNSLPSINNDSSIHSNKFNSNDVMEGVAPNCFHASMLGVTKHLKSRKTEQDEHSSLLSSSIETRDQGREGSTFKGDNHPFFECH